MMEIKQKGNLIPYAISGFGLVLIIGILVEVLSVLFVSNPPGMV
jgi:preprotein translocase subunit SecF